MGEARAVGHVSQGEQTYELACTRTTSAPRTTSRVRSSCNVAPAELSLPPHQSVVLPESEADSGPAQSANMKKYIQFTKHANSVRAVRRQTHPADSASPHLPPPVSRLPPADFCLVLTATKPDANPPHTIPTRLNRRTKSSRRGRRAPCAKTSTASTLSPSLRLWRRAKPSSNSIARRAAPTRGRWTLAVAGGYRTRTRTPGRAWGWAGAAARAWRARGRGQGWRSTPRYLTRSSRYPTQPYR